VTEREAFTGSLGNEFPEGLSLKIKIQKSSYIGGDFRYRDCEDLYYPGSELIIILSNDKIKKGDSFNVNKTINGAVEFDLEKKFISYELVKEKNNILERIINWFKSLFSKR